MARRMSRKNKRKIRNIIILLIVVIGGIIGIKEFSIIDGLTNFASGNDVIQMSEETGPEYEGKPYVEINGNDPDFTEKEIEMLSSAGYEYYSALDGLGRCGYAECCAGRETMPSAKEEREDIYMVHPSGWNNEYGFEERCHLVAWCLSGENANDHNLITGTHEMNQAMLQFELQIAKYIDQTGNHVMYKVEPVFYKTELVTRGVHIQAKSIEDNGWGVSFNVFCFNRQDGYEIDYGTGEIAPLI